MLAAGLGQNTLATFPGYVHTQINTQFLLAMTVCAIQGSYDSSPTFIATFHREEASFSLYNTIPHNTESDGTLAVNSVPTYKIPPQRDCGNFKEDR